MNFFIEYVLTILSSDIPYEDQEMAVFIKNN